MDAGTRMDAGPVSGPSGLLPGLLFNPLSDLLPACPNRPVRIVARFLFRTKVAIFSDAARK